MCRDSCLPRCGLGLRAHCCMGGPACAASKRQGGPEWLSIGLVALRTFLCDYGLLFWAETRVPSETTAVMMATIPAFMAIAEVGLLRTRRLTVSLAATLLVGLVGVAVLTVPSVRLDGAAIGGAEATALVFGAMSCSVASVLTRRLPMPESKAVNAAAQMLGGRSITGDCGGRSGRISAVSCSGGFAWSMEALAYLIAAGSIVAYTAYAWLLHHESPTRVATYAYVNDGGRSGRALAAE